MIIEIKQNESWKHDDGSVDLLFALTVNEIDYELTIQQQPQAVSVCAVNDDIEPAAFNGDYWHDEHGIDIEDSERVAQFIESYCKNIVSADFR